MRVLVISAAFPPMKVGGADYALRLCQQYAANGADVHVLTSRIPGMVTDPALHIHPIMDDWNWPEHRRIIALAKRVRPDVIDIHFQGKFYHFHPMITFVATLLKRVLPGVRVVTHIEWPMPSAVHRHPRVTRAARRLAVRWAGVAGVDYGYGTLLRDSDAVIVLSDTHRVELEAACAGVSARTVLIPPAPLMRRADGDHVAARARGRALLGESENAQLLVFFGYVYPGKGIETLLDAMALLTPEWPDLRLVMIGAGLDDADRKAYYPAVQARAETLGLADRIHWTGYYEAESDHASLYLHAADCCVLPFDLGVYLNNSSFAAAMAHGLPTVTTPGTPVEPPFRDGENLLFAEAKNAASVAAAVARVLSDTGLRERLQQGAFAFAAEWFAMGRSVERTMAVLEARS